MPYCSSCGAHIKEGFRFCKECGRPVEDMSNAHVNSQVSHIEQQREIRKSSLDEINKMINYFGQKQAQYDEYDNCVEQISYYSKPNAVVKLNEKVYYSKKHLIFIGIGLIAFGLFMLMFVLMFYSSSIELRDNTKFPIGGLLFSIVLIGGGITLLVFGITGQIAYNTFFHEHKARVKAEKERLLKYYQERYDALSKELSVHYANYGYCAVAAPYTNPKILQEIKAPIDMGRADTIKEAMNLLIQDAHNKEMELQASLTANSARSAAQGANVAAFFTAASFINDLRR